MRLGDVLGCVFFSWNIVQAYSGLLWVRGDLPCEDPRYHRHMVPAPWREREREKEGGGSEECSMLG